MSWKRGELLLHNTCGSLGFRIYCDWVHWSGRATDPLAAPIRPTYPPHRSHWLNARQLPKAQRDQLMPMEIGRAWDLMKRRGRERGTPKLNSATLGP
ncbi:MAG: hypothetical protein ACI8QS_002771 [Planctomycetota bacterium]|jgi:hypothetical protein